MKWLDKYSQGRKLDPGAVLILIVAAFIVIYIGVSLWNSLPRNDIECQPGTCLPQALAYNSYP